MNTSKTNLYLKQLSETIVNAPSSPSLKCEVDTIPALALNSGIIGSKTLRTTIATDDNVSTKLTNIDATLVSMDTAVENIDTSLNNIEASRKLNFSSVYENLQWSGSSNSLSAGDYSSTTGKAWFQNTSGQTAIITKITFGFMSSETTWNKSKIFTSTASAGSSWIRWGTADDTTAIDTEIIKFNHNGEITSCMVQNFAHPDGSGDVYYGFAVNDLNIILDNNEYFMCEFSGTINASGDDDIWSGIYLDVKQS